MPWNSQWVSCDSWVILASNISAAKRHKSSRAAWPTDSSGKTLTLESPSYKMFNKAKKGKCMSLQS